MVRPFGRYLLALCATLPLLLATPARADEFTQWVNGVDCAATRGSWLAVAKEHPGFGWDLAPGAQSFSTFAAAMAWMDVLRLTSTAFRNYCCWTAVYTDMSGASPFPVMATGRIGMPPTPPANAMPRIAWAPCCEDAAFALGSDPLGCTAVPLVSVPGAVAVITPSGPASPSGPLTIPTDPPTTVAALSPPAKPKVAAGTYLGCFKDPNNPFNLDGHLERSRQNTPQRCLEICRAKGFAYAGVEWSESCLCGNSYDAFGRAENCNMPCTGDPGQTCGGSNANSVYATGL